MGGIETSITLTVNGIQGLQQHTEERRDANAAALIMVSATPDAPEGDPRISAQAERGARGGQHAAKSLQVADAVSDANAAPRVQHHPGLENYLAGLLATAIVPPFLATATALILVLYDPSLSFHAPVWGLVVSVLVWCVLAGIAQPFLTMHRANPAVYCTLNSRYEILKAQMGKVKTKLQDHKDDPILYALAEMSEYQSILKLALEHTSKTNCAQDWLGAAGYIRLWELLHRAEETRFLLAPVETVHADACFDMVRLTGSNVDSREKLLHYLKEGLQLLKNSRKDVTEPGVFTAAQKQDEFKGRELLRYVRRSINKFRDEQRLNLIQARNRLLRTVTVTAWVCFTIAAVVITTTPTLPPLKAAILFFLIGALVGLFNQLHLDARTETATEDYGLTTARLVYTPCFSGLAALGGILFMPILVSVSAMAQPVPASAMAQPSPWELTNVFTLSNQANFILAALFGLTPHVLISRLHQATEKYKTDLRRTNQSMSPSK